MSKPAIAIAAAVGLLGIAGLLHAAHEADALAVQDAPSRSTAAPEESADEPELEQRTSYLRGWRLALTQRPADEPDAQADDGEDDQRPAATTFAPELYFDEAHINIVSVTFGADRFFALDTGRIRSPGWPCDAACIERTRPLRTPNVSAYTPAGDLDPNLGFEPVFYDGADTAEAITYAAGKLYILNRNPPKVYVYTTDGRRVPDEDFYLAGGERAREEGYDDDMAFLPIDFTYAAGRFYILDRGTNNHSPKVFVHDTAGTRIPEAEFRIDGLNYRVCGSGDNTCESVDHIGHANGTLYVQVWLWTPEWPNVDDPFWTYTLDGTRTGTLRFDESARFTQGLTHANDWFYLLSGYSSTEPQRICAYTPQGQRVAPSDRDRYC